MANDVVNHPSHYTQGKIECIDFITDKKMNFCRGNAVKYIVRAGLKDKSKEIEDLEKAIFYLRREIKDLQEAENSDTAPGMVNLEKVIKGLNLCTNGEGFPPCKDCPYDAECEKAIGMGQSPLARDAIALLKEQAQNGWCENALCDFICHQCDVIELLMSALSVATKKRKEENSGGDD